MKDKAKLFEYAAIYHPSEDERKAGAESKVIVQPTTLLAKDKGVATLKVARAIPSEYESKLEQVDIVIRPF